TSASSACAAICSSAGAAWGGRGGRGPRLRWPRGFPAAVPSWFPRFLWGVGRGGWQGWALSRRWGWAALGPAPPAEEESLAAGLPVMQAALDSLAGESSPAAVAVREQYDAARTVAQNIDHPQQATAYDELRLRAIKHQRKALERLRSEGAIGDEAYHRLEEEI